MKNFVQALYQSFYSKELYHDVAVNRKGSGLGVLFWLSLLCSVMLIVKFASISPQDYRIFKQSLTDQTPQVTIENGALSIDRPTPYYMALGGQPHAIVIDTSEDTGKLSLDDILKTMDTQKTSVFIGKSKIIGNNIQNKGEFRVYDLSDIKEKVTFGKPEIAKLIRLLEITFIPMVFIFSVIGIFIYKIIQMFIYSVFGIIMEKLVTTGADYSAIQRITAYALIPATVLDIALGLFGSTLPFALSFACTLIFIFFGLKSIKPNAA